jgi:outer membrane protein assembly factor BamA
MRLIFCGFSILSAIALLAVNLPVTAQKFQPKSIQFEGDPEYSDQELLDAAGLKKGTVLTSAEMNEHSKRLMDSGAFDTLTFKFDGQDLIYSLVPSTTLYPLRLENLPLMPGKDLDSKLHDLFPLYHGKVPAEGTLLDNVRSALEEMLSAQGIKATVTATPTGALSAHKVSSMSFAISSQAVQVGEIHLQGVSSALQAKVNSVVDQTVKSTYDTENTAINIEHAFAAVYADEGYAAVKVKASQSGNPVVGAEAIQVPFNVSVQEGHLYKLGSVRLPSDAPLTQAEIDRSLGLASHSNAIAKGLSLRSTWLLIASRYKSKGYLDVVVTPHPEFDESAGSVSYTVEVNPGSVYHLAFVKFDNVSDDLRKLLMRSWQMLPGDPFDEGYVANFINKMQTEDPLLLRVLAHVKVTYNVLADPQTHEVNCIIKLERLP